MSATPWKVREVGREAVRELAALAVRSNDTPYPLEQVIEEKCFEPGPEGDPIVAIVEEGGLLGMAVLSGRYLRLLAVDRQRRRLGIGSALLGWASTRARASGAKRLVLGAEPGNYFVPGPMRDDAASIAFFQTQSMKETGEAIHLVADLASVPWLSRVRPIRGIRIERAAEAKEALDFIEREFGSLWRFEVAHAFLESSPPLYLAREEGRVIGFSAHDVNNRGLGFYGPAGVMKSHRGAGVGRELLLASLADLAERGYQRTIIPWVSSVDFYRKIAEAEIDTVFTTAEVEL